MNINLLHHLCEVYQIGSCLSEPIPCRGGLLHHTYRFETTEGQFVIKYLYPAIINQTGKKDRYRITEFIARQLSQHVSGITAITHEGDPLFTFENETVMVFPYVNAAILQQHDVTLPHIEKIAQMLSKIHQANIQVDHVPSVEFPDQSIVARLEKYVPDIGDIYEKLKLHKEVLENNLVISHRDCDPKNVLWDKKGNYFIIDWESAGWINRTKDVLVTAIYWSFDEHYHIRLDYLLEFLRKYQGEINEQEIEAGLYGLLGDWIEWLDFNLSRKEIALGAKEAHQTIVTIPILFSQFSGITDYLKNGKKS